MFWICRQNVLDFQQFFFLDLSTIFFGFVYNYFWICRQLFYGFVDKNKQCANDTIQWPHHCVGHTAWAPEGREGRSQAGPKGHQLEVGARRAPKLLVYTYSVIHYQPFSGSLGDGTRVKCVVASAIRHARFATLCPSCGIIAGWHHSSMTPW